jgi:hypothetical protein
MLCAVAVSACSQSELQCTQRGKVDSLRVDFTAMGAQAPPEGSLLHICKGRSCGVGDVSSDGGHVDPSGLWAEGEPAPLRIDVYEARKDALGATQEGRLLFSSTGTVLAAGESVELNGPGCGQQRVLNATVRVAASGRSFTQAPAR